MNLAIKSAEKNLCIGAFLSFVGINMRFISVNIVKPLILFDVLRPTNHAHHYELHVPNMPDMCGDVATMVILAVAYLFLTSVPVKLAANGASKALCKAGSKYTEPIENRINWSKGVFHATILGFVLYFISKYYLSIDVEVFAGEGEEFTFSSALIYFNYVVKLTSALVFAYAYCKYLSPCKSVKILLYTFFFVRNILATNLLGLITHYDLFPGAPLLDILSPIIIVYSIISIIIQI